jgi:hypothetical protein
MLLGVLSCVLSQIDDQKEISPFMRKQERIYTKHYKTNKQTNKNTWRRKVK